MADPRLWVKVVKILKTRFLPEIEYSGVFWVTDYESAVRIEQILLLRWRIQDGRLQIMGKRINNAENENLTLN